MLRNTKITQEDFIFGALLFGVHVWWLLMNQSSYENYTRDGFSRIQKNLPVGPTEYLIEKYLLRMRLPGIGPGPQPWKGCILPLN